MLQSGVCHRISSEKLKFYFFLPKCTFLKLWPRWTEFLPAELMLSSSCVHASCVTEPVSNESHFPRTKAHVNPKCDDFLRLCFHFITTHQNTISTVNDSRWKHRNNCEPASRPPQQKDEENPSSHSTELLTTQEWKNGTQELYIWELAPREPNTSNVK